MTEKSKYVRFDWAIKRILRDKANKEVLEGLITVLLGDPIKITEILESEGNQDAREDKTNRVDVKAKTSDGELIIVEVQLTKERDFFHRILFGTAKNITDQIGIGMDYAVIKKIYSINILYFDFGRGDDYAYHGMTTFKGMTKKDSVLSYKSANEECYIDKSARRVTFPDEVFPEFFLLIVDKFNEVARTPIEEWMRYLKDAVISDDTTAPGLQAAREKLAYMSMTEKERRAYTDYMVSVHAARDAWETSIDEAEAKGHAAGLEEGHAAGLVEGHAAGLEEGHAVGLEEGHAAGLEEGHAQANINNARRMKHKGFSVEDISDITGLTPEEIGQL
ncbi:MAG: Rpn family recombination-promoting nuclease/putative transposase [Bacteroidaceae bacterium]|nr:Rpn family recombination-promoting nuclease/putative transposase [Bacteroidaceae bacterium]